MKRQFLILAACLILPFQLFARQADDCSPDAVREWMVQRQIGRNQLQPILDAPYFPNLIETLLDVQEIRRNLEDLPRPTCADKLYILTIYLYDAMSDFLALQANLQSELAQTLIQQRFEVYTRETEPIYLELEEIAGVDVYATAAAIVPVATAIPTAIPPAPIYLRGSQGGMTHGPIDIPAGVYRVRLTGQQINASMQVISGSCNSFYLYTTQDTNANEEAFTSSGCRALIEIGMSANPWELVFTPVQ